MGTANSQRLKPWLDPGNYGPEKWEGAYAGTLPDPEFAADETNLQPGETVTYTDMTTGNPLEWQWTFEGGQPGSFNGQTPPAITYNNPGKYTVTLEASNTLGSVTLDSIDMIVVGGPLADFSASNTYLTSGEAIDFTDETSGDPIEWTWTFYGGIPETSTEQNPAGILYNAQGSYDVKLVAVNQYGTDSITKEGFVVVDGPFAEFEADLTNILAGESVTFSDMSINNPTSWSWKFFGGSPGSHNGQDPPPVTYASAGSYDVKLTVTNELGSHFITKEGYIQVGGVGIDEPDAEEIVRAYPNPTQGNLVVEPGQLGKEGTIITIASVRGETISSMILDGPTEKVNLQIGDQPAGIYLLTVTSAEATIVKKITLNR